MVFGQTEYEVHNYNMSGVNQHRLQNPQFYPFGGEAHTRLRSVGLCAKNCLRFDLKFDHISEFSDKPNTRCTTTICQE